MNARTNGRTDECVDEWTNAGMNERANERMTGLNERASESKDFCSANTSQNHARTRSLACVVCCRPGNFSGTKGRCTVVGVVVVVCPLDERIGVRKRDTYATMTAATTTHAALNAAKAKKAEPSKAVPAFSMSISLEHI